ncbi:MAG: zf-HC2 domain-containing protein [Gemmatimonadota bacterium]
MTIDCQVVARDLDAYRDGTLHAARCEELEAHAAQCDACLMQLERVTAGMLPVFAPTPPSTLRDDVLRAVAVRRRSRRLPRLARTAGALAAAALLFVMLRPTTAPPAPTVADSTIVAVPVSGASSASADEIARSEFRALDDAARELQAELTRTPGDAELTALLRRIDDQRASLRRQVQDARS